MQIRNIERNHQLNVMILIWPSYRPLTSCTSSGAHRLPWINIMVQPKSICSCSNDLAVLVWAGHEARPSPRAEVHHSAILEGKTVPTADPVTNAIRINSSRQLVEKGRLNYVSSHRKALLSWPSASHPPVSLCSLSPVLRSFFQLNPPMDLRSGYGQSKEDPSGSVQQFGDRLSTCQSRIHPFSPLVHCLRTFYGSDGVIRTVTAHQLLSNPSSLDHPFLPDPLLPYARSNLNSSVSSTRETLQKARLPPSVNQSRYPPRIRTSPKNNVSRRFLLCNS